MSERDHLKIMSFLISKDSKEAQKCSRNVTWTYPCQRNHKDICINLPHNLTEVKNLCRVSHGEWKYPSSERDPIPVVFLADQKTEVPGNHTSPLPANLRYLG